MLGPRMELRHLRYFVAVAGEENVSRAALKLHVSQPALSRQIRDLEDELGVELFERSAKSVSLTEAGRVLWDEAEAILKRVDGAIEATRTAARGGVGELHVGYAPSPTARLLPTALRAFQSAAPGVRVLLHDLSTEEMLARLRDGGLQLAILVKPERAMLRGLKFEELALDAIQVAVAPGHPFAKRRSVRIEDVAGERLLAYSREGYPEYHESLALIFGKGRGRPRIAEEHDGINSLAAAVAAGNGVALVSESVACLAGPRLKLVALSPAPKPLVIGAVWPTAGLAPAAQEFLKHARTAASQG
jgi:DNA-binding transcriptional LysR family regulator